MHTKDLWGYKLLLWWSRIVWKSVYSFKSDLCILFDNIIGTKILALFLHKSQKLYWYCYCLNFQILKLQFCYSFAIVGLQNSKYWVVQSLILVLYWYCKFAFFHLSKIKLINFLMNYGKYSKKLYFLLFKWLIFENITYYSHFFLSFGHFLHNFTSIWLKENAIVQFWV